MWDTICGDIKGAEDIIVKVLGYLLLILKDWANTQSWRGNTFADNQNG